MAGVFAYIIKWVDKNYAVTGTVPWVSEGRTVFGPCKKYMRPKVEQGDYIMGISPAGVGDQRRVLLWMQVQNKMTFGKAYANGETDHFFHTLRGGPIHVRPKHGVVHHKGKPETYEHIPGGPHRDDWESDIQGERDCFFVGSDSSRVGDAGSMAVTEQLLLHLKAGILRAGTQTLANPLTENARGRHALVLGSDAEAIISMVKMPERTIQDSNPRSSNRCSSNCSEDDDLDECE